MKSDRHGGYTPPTEIFSLRNRLKTRQVRRLKTLCRRYKTLPLDDFGYPGESPCLKDAYLEWKCILNAKGYGHCWKNWILSFEVVPAVSLWLPSFEALEIMTEITRHDCDQSCRDESSKRAAECRCKIHIDISDDYGKMSYKLIQAKQVNSLADVPVDFSTHATLLRSRHGSTALMMSEAQYGRC